MRIVGISHKTAPIEIREKFYLNPTEQELLLSELKNNPLVTESFVLSTCNRIEVYIKRLDTTVDFLLRTRDGSLAENGSPCARGLGKNQKAIALH